MHQKNRREFLQQSLAASAGWSLLSQASLASEEPGRGLHLAPFRFDVTPPKGHGLCGGWIKPVESVDDPLEAIGFVLLGSGKPMVLCAVDWTGLLNEAHVEWRAALAEAAGTTPERVAVQCVHQHDAPFACLEGEKIVQAQKNLPSMVDLDFYKQCLDRGRAAVAEGLKKARPVTAVACGEGKVEKVAGNRRVSRTPEGVVKAMRGSGCRDEALRALPEGLIDPMLKTVAFYDGETKIAACHYYATHPMSHYGQGRVSSDFAGLARKRIQQEQPDCLHLYFTGCAGNVAAGKYNDGTPPMRGILMQRIYDGIVAAEKTLKPQPVNGVGWQAVDALPPALSTLSVESLEKLIGDSAQSVVNRNRTAYMLSWLRRLERKTPIVLSSLRVNDISLLHLPSECFVEYQLRAQQIAPTRFVATAAYGDGGPWYIPVKEEYPHGGYEVSVAFCDPGVDDVLTQGMRKLLG